MSASEKDDVDLILDDVAEYLEKGSPVMPEDNFGRYHALWHAVLYLHRAVKAMREEEREGSGKKNPLEGRLDLLQRRIDHALAWLVPFIEHSNYEPMPRIKKAVAILRGEVDV